MSYCRQQKPASGALSLSRGEDSSLDAFNREHYTVQKYCSSFLMFQFVSFSVSDRQRAKKETVTLPQEPVGLRVNLLQIRLDGPYFAAFWGNRTTITLQNRQKLSSPSRIFASISYVRQAPCRMAGMDDGYMKVLDVTVVRTLSIRLLPQTSNAVSRGRLR